MIRRLSDLLARFSDRSMLLALLVVPLIPLLALAWGLIIEARRSDAERVAILGRHLLATLEDGGTPALRREIVLMGEAQRFALGVSPISAGVWRRGELIAETGTVAGDDLLQIPARTVKAEIAGLGTFLVFAPDIAAESQAWEAPVADLSLRLATAAPGPAERAALQIVFAAASLYGFALLVGLTLHAHHRLRYRAGLVRINTQLQDFAGGDMTARLDSTQPAPELVELAGLINPVLARLAIDIADLRDFSALAAHEMRTPIQLAQQDLDRLRAGGDGEFAKRLGMVQGRIHVALGAFEAVMLLIRYLAERDTPLPETRVNLSDRLDWALDSLGTRLEREDRPPDVEIAPDVLVCGDIQQIDRLLFNLLENAAKYAPADARIRITLTTWKKHFHLSVANSGGGFPPDIRDNAFDRFTRSKSAGSKHGFGIGLGLVKTICARHGFTAHIVPSEDIAEIVIEGASEISDI